MNLNLPELQTEIQATLRRNLRILTDAEESRPHVTLSESGHTMVSVADVSDMLNTAAANLAMAMAERMFEHTKDVVDELHKRLFAAPAGAQQCSTNDTRK